MQRRDASPRRHIQLDERCFVPHGDNTTPGSPVASSSQWGLFVDSEILSARSCVGCDPI